MDRLTGLLSRLAPNEKWIPKDQLHLQGIADAILANKFKNIIVMTGAGISVAAGIPDFRSANGLYETIKQQFPTIKEPRDLFSIEFVI